ncbi:PAS domain-containing protein [Methylobacterium persicinum]
MSSRLSGQDYLHDAQEVCAGGTVIQRRIVTRDGDRTLSLRVLPYRLQNGSVDGATLVLTDITEALALERQLAAERERLELAVKAGGIGVWEFNPDAGTIVFDSTAGGCSVSPPICPTAPRPWSPGSSPRTGRCCNRPSRTCRTGSTSLRPACASGRASMRPGTSGATGG